MALAPFSPGGVQVRRTAEMFVQLRQQGVDLERQLTTGKKAETFAGLGFERRTALDLRGKLSALEGFQATIKDADLRLKLMLQSTQNLQQIASDTRAGALLPSSGVSGGQPLEQAQAQGNLKLAIDLLNADINGRYLFSGRTHDQKPVLSYDTIVGDLAPLIAAAKTANDADPGGTGTLSVASAGPAATVTDGGAGGFGLVGVTSSNPGAITAAAPATFTVTAPPAAGDAISLRLSLPDGSEETITLTAAAAPGVNSAGQFVIDADNNVTAANIATALGLAIGERATGALASASAMTAAETYFATDANWYAGDTAPAADARSTAPARIDQTQVVGTGAQANEEGFRTLLTQLAALSADTFADGNRDRLDALLMRVAGNLTPGQGEQKISDIGVELGNAHGAMANARERHQATAAMLQNTLGGIEDAPSEEVAAKLLALQTRLQASYQTTSLLSKLSLVNYL